MTEHDLGAIDWAQCPHLHRHPEMRGGQWCFEGTSLRVAHLFQCLAAGASIGEYVQQYPIARADHVDAVLSYIADRLQAVDTRGRGHS